MEKEKDTKKKEKVIASPDDPKKRENGSSVEISREEIETSKEYDIPEETEDLDTILSELRGEESGRGAKHPKSVGSQGKGKRSKTRKRSEDEMLERLNEKNQALLELNKKNKSLEREINESRDKWLRTLAEFENYRKRSQKEWELLQHKAKADVICEMLNILDDFERAFSVVEGKEDDFVEGIRMIHKNFVQSLAKFGVRPIEAIGKAFDPKYHMAVGQIESKREKSGHVVEVSQKGYLLEDTVIRPAKVIIAK